MRAELERRDTAMAVEMAKLKAEVDMARAEAANEASLKAAAERAAAAEVLAMQEAAATLASETLAMRDERQRATNALRAARLQKRKLTAEAIELKHAAAEARRSAERHGAPESTKDTRKRVTSLTKKRSKSVPVVPVASFDRRKTLNRVPRTCRSMAVAHIAGLSQIAGAVKSEAALMNMQCMKTVPSAKKESTVGGRVGREHLELLADELAKSASSATSRRKLKLLAKPRKLVSRESDVKPDSPKLGETTAAAKIPVRLPKAAAPSRPGKKETEEAGGGRDTAFLLKSRDPVTPKAPARMGSAVSPDLPTPLTPEESPLKNLEESLKHSQPEKLAKPHNEHTHVKGRDPQLRAMVVPMPSSPSLMLVRKQRESRSQAMSGLDDADGTVIALNVAAVESDDEGWKKKPNEEPKVSVEADRLTSLPVRNIQIELCQRGPRL